jgi:hypothetical protein
VLQRISARVDHRSRGSVKTRERFDARACRCVDHVQRTRVEVRRVRAVLPRCSTALSFAVLGAALTSACQGAELRAGRARDGIERESAGSSGASAMIAPTVASRAEQLAPSVRSRIDAVAAAFVERGARPLDAEWSSFVAPGEAQVARVTIDRAQCIGFVAVGPAALRKIALRVHDASGVLLGEHSDDAHPYVRLCARDESRMTLVVRAVEGQGQVALLLLAQPPLVAPDLERALGEHREGGLTGPRTPRAAVGADPTIESATDALDRHRARIAPLGYRPLSPPTVATIDRRAPMDQRYDFEAGRCYGILLATEGNTDSLTIEVRDPEARPLIAPRPIDRDPLTRGCLSRSGSYTVRLTAREEMRVALQALVIDDPLPLAADIVGEVRAGVFELHGEAVARSLSRVRSVQRVAAVGAPFVQTIAMRAGQCAMVGVASSGTAVELSLNDPDGRIVASDTGATSTPRVWHCATRAQQLRVTARPLAARGEFALVVFEDGGAL